MSKYPGYFCVMIFFVLFAGKLSGNQTMTVNLKEKIAISPKNLGDGKWMIARYDKELIELIEDKKEPFQSYEFRAIKTGKGQVMLKYAEKNKPVKVLIYKINVVVKNKKYRGRSLKEKKDFRFSMTANIKKKKSNSLIKQRPFKKRKGNLSYRKNDMTYSLPEKAIMKNGDIFYAYIRKLIARSLNHQAIIEIEKFRLLFPNHPKISKINLLKGEIYINQEQYHQAVSWYRGLIEESDLPFAKKGKLMLLLGQTYEKNQDTEKAKLTYIKILTLMNDSKILAQSHFNLGQIYFKEKKMSKGIKELETLIQKYPETEQTRETSLYMLGEMYYTSPKLRNYKVAYKYFRTLVEEYPAGLYYDKAIKTMKYLEDNFIKYY